MNPKLKTFLRYFISSILTVGFLYFAFRGTDFGKLFEILSNANYWWVLAMFPVLLLSHGIRAWRWRYLLEPVKQDLRFRYLFSSLIIGYMMNNVAPRAGELVRPYAISKFEGVSRSAAFGTVFVERILDVISFMILIALIPVVYSGPLAETFPWLAEMGIWITIVTFIFLGLFLFLMVRRDIVIKILNFFTKNFSEHRSKLIEHITHSFLDGFLFFKKSQNYLIFILTTILIWGLYVIMMYLPFYAFGLVEKYNLDIGSALVVQAISSIGILIPTPGATGPYHYFAIQTLTKLYGVEDDLARSYAAVTHAIGFIGITLLGIYFFFRDNLKIAEVMKQKEE
ncbi:MAG: flippase-like domain-containing protein [Bacteroidetes bacterium]|nr:flippase-like domain-containing protein [Bacteroidota bacterium]MBU1423403.1 flippase-like domain-containing protein [Bacteroidota bacterium]MBU2471364.1 flippase-like domain-containing protein [Bacteroidota bacterium]